MAVNAGDGLIRTSPDLLPQAVSECPPLADEAAEQCIHDVVSQQARTRPTAPAVCAWDGQLTHGELDELSTRLAGHLAGLGVRPEAVVPLCFEKSMWTTVAMLGVLKAGGAFVLLDPALPEKRLENLCQQVHATTAITSVQCRGRLSAFTQHALVLDRPFLSGLASAVPPVPTKAQPTNAAYIIFTSGSTGEPKGCVIEHRSYCTSAQANGPVVGFNEETRALQFSSYSFAGAMVETLMTLMHGGCVCVVAEEDRCTNLDGAVGRLNANWAFLTPTALAYLTPANVPSLRTICVGGEPIRIGQIKEWASRVCLRQTYGSAETSAYICSAPLTEASTTSGVGKPTVGRCWIVDASNLNQPVSPGLPGEIIVEGAVVGRGYMGLPKQSSTAFIDAPAWRLALGPCATGSRFYKTGDLAVCNSDGSIDMLGRKDTQVKLRGQRIEIGEIENKARQATPDISDVAVELAELDLGQGKSPALIGFLVPRLDDVEAKDAQMRTIVQTIRARLDEVLPQYMVPSALVFIPSLPLTPSGKTDRRRLRMLGSALSPQQLTEHEMAAQGQQQKPQTEAERRLRDLWAQVLKIDADVIGADDSFFRLGGNSVAVMRLVAAARKTGANMVVADIFQKPVLKAQACVLVDS